MNKVFSGWNWMRVIRLALGVFIVIQGVHDKSLVFATLGVLFAMMAVFNAGCCYAGSCQMPDDNADKSQIENSEKI
ncbi:MAG TPA: hypothetical protein PLU85_06305 [Bacteroidia bacterium]|nr:hypothetical protein [Bacteroidia bacterium]HOZ90349.1 hypothetical protein [Bacteroidia bacterium]HQW18374.1 hypothetical protein [Bacteroidia bacterium]HQW49778.1 hypothetical protein [Bacteroidia bacterium]HQX70014.1 hypothetical protein [Bacteroidia bacterium]